MEETLIKRSMPNSHWFHDHGQRCDIDGDGDADE